MYIKSVSVLTILSFFLTSCCTMLCDPTRQVKVTAQQRDVEVVIDGYACGTAPLSVKLDKACDHTIIVSKPGCQSQRKYLKSQRTLKSSSNIIAPIAGAAVGIGIGALVPVYGVYSGVFGAAIGGAIGLGVGIIGTGVDIHKRSDCDLDMKKVHFNLSQAN